MKTRTLKVSDYDRIVALWQKSGLPFKPKGRDGKEAVQAQMETDPDFFIGVFEDSRLVGVVVASTDGRRGWINRLAVDSDYRRRGVAKTLIWEAEKTLRKRGVRIFCALIEVTNAGSMRLFRNCGYTVHGNIVYFSKRDSDWV